MNPTRLDHLHENVRCLISGYKRYWGKVPWNIIPAGYCDRHERFYDELFSGEWVCEECFYEAFHYDQGGLDD